VSEAVLRTATPADAEAIRAIIARALLAAGFPAPDTDLDADLLDLSHYAFAGRGFWVAERDGAVIGCVALDRGTDGHGVLKRIAGEALPDLVRLATDAARVEGYRHVEAVAPPGFTGAAEALLAAGYAPAGTPRSLLYAKWLDA